MESLFHSKLPIGSCTLWDFNVWTYPVYAFVILAVGTAGLLQVATPPITLYWPTEIVRASHAVRPVRPWLYHFSLRVVCPIVRGKKKRKKTIKKCPWNG